VSSGKVIKFAENVNSAIVLKLDYWAPNWLFNQKIFDRIMTVENLRREIGTKNIHKRHIYINTEKNAWHEFA